MSYKNRDHILQTLEKFGAICDCQSGRYVISIKKLIN